MKATAVLLSAVGWVCLAQTPPSAPAETAAPPVRTVYLLPMAHGLDQYLASRLTRGGVVEVLADPAKADAVFTDRLGESLEQTLDELFPAPQPAAAKPEPGGDSRSMLAAEAAPRPAGRFSRGRGTLFLVSAQTRAVLWSVFERPTSTTPEDLDRTAERIAKQLQRELKPKSK